MNQIDMHFHRESITRNMCKWTIKDLNQIIKYKDYKFKIKCLKYF